MKSTLQYIHQFRERRAVVEAALFLIKEGRFQNSAIRDIAFRARLTESTALHFFPDRATLLDELELFVTHEIRATLAGAMALTRETNLNLENAWKALYKFYTLNPGILKFVDQSTTILGETERVKKFFNALNEEIITYLNSTNAIFSAQQAAAVFHANIVSTAKLTCEQAVPLSDRQLKALAISTCRIILKKVSRPLATLPVAED